MSYNIRFDNPGDDMNRWDNRKEGVVEMINAYSPDIIGVQEALLHQLIYLDEELANYSRLGEGRGGGDSGEFSPIFYRTKKLYLIEGGTFWLSESQERRSVGWDAALPRICTYALFQNQASKEKFLVFNTHYDHRGVIARKASSKLIVEKIHKLNPNQYPVFLIGDFNAGIDEKPILSILENLDDASILAENGLEGPRGTYTGFDERDLQDENRIDYIFVKSISSVKAYRHIDDRNKEGNLLSDHLPVLLEID